MNHTMISVLSIDDDPEIYEILQLYLAGIAEVEYAPNAIGLPGKDRWEGCAFGKDPSGADGRGGLRGEIK